MISLENFDLNSEYNIDCFGNVLVQIRDMSGTLLNEQFLAGTMDTEEYQFIDHFPLPPSPFIVDFTNMSTFKCTAGLITEINGVRPHASTRVYIPNGVTYRQTITASNSLFLKGSIYPELPISANSCDIDTIGVYNETQNAVQLSPISPVGIPSNMFQAFIPNVQFFDTNLGWMYPNPFYFKKKVCQIPVEDVFNCYDQDLGIGQYVNIISSRDLSAMPYGYDATPTLSNSDFVSAVGSFEYLPNKKFTRFQTLHDSRLFDLASDGTVGQLRPKGSFTFRLQHSKAALGALKKMVNERLILVFQNARNEKIIIGTLLFPAQITAYNATLSDKEAFIEITVQNSIKYPLYFSGNL